MATFRTALTSPKPHLAARKAFRTGGDGTPRAVPTAKARAAVTEAALLESQQGAPSILDSTIAVKGFTAQQSVAELMNGLRVQLGFTDAELSQDDMQKYVRMGERIVRAVVETPKGQLPTVTTTAGLRVTVRPTIEAARAVAWYLQAKAMQDNRGPDRAATTPGRTGTMIIRDPDNKLFNFLNGCPQCYDRISSHLTHESQADRRVLGKPMHRGIEDFLNKMPGGRGTLLLVKLTDDEHGGRLLFKNERAGVSMPNRTHADSEEGVQLGRTVGALGRSGHHATNFVSKIWLKKGSKDAGDGSKVDRGENPKRGAFGEIKTEFTDLLKQLGASARDADSRHQFNKWKTLKFFHQIEPVVSKMLESSGSVPAEHRGAVGALAGRLKSHAEACGANLGLQRYANEVHVLLPEVSEAARGIESPGRAGGGAAVAMAD